MKNRIFLLSIIMILLCGCGQEFDVTVYNKSGITCSGTTDPTWIAINSSLKNVDGTDITFFPSGVALSEADVNPTNSVTFKAKENQTLSIHANGNEYTYDSNGNTSGIKTFEIKTIEQVLYGEFLSEPHWYAAVYKDNVIIYKK